MFTTPHRGKIFFLPLEGRVCRYCPEAGKEIIIAVTRAMKELREMGAVWRADRHVVIKAAEALRRIAEHTS